MKKITIVAMLALLLMPLFSQTMEQKKRKFEGKEKIGEQKRIKPHEEGNPIVKIDSWESCPVEIKMQILYFVLDPNILMNAMDAKDMKTILAMFRQWAILRFTCKEFSNLALDKQLFNLIEINGNLLEKFPDCLLELLKKAAKFGCRYVFQLPSNIVLPLEENIFGLLSIASSKGHTEFCKKLIIAGIFDGTNKNISLIHAICLREYHTVKKLIEKGIDTALLEGGLNQIDMASEIGDTAILKLLLDAKPSEILSEDDDGETALMRASDNGHKEAVKLLLGRGVIIDGKNNNGETALMRAAFNGHKEVVELLLASGAVIDEKNNDGDTALIRAAFNGKKEVVELLLSKDADINEKANNGDTALILASYKGHKEVVKLLLLDREVNIDAENNDGETALMLASYNGQGEVVELLIARGAVITK